MQYQNELRKLKQLVSNDVWTMFERHNVIIAGGAITSVFCNREVNDIDVYFRKPQDYLKFVYDIYEGEFRYELLVANITNRSVLLKDKHTNQHVQLIVYKFFENELAVFKDFDFTCNMGALSFGWEKIGHHADAQFVLHSEFLKHNSQRYLSFNEGTAYPFISALRVAKYVEKGYNISKAQMLKVLMAVNNISLNSWEEVKDHVGGMYGLNFDEVFPIHEGFSMSKVIESLHNVFSEDSKYQGSNVKKFDDLYKPVSRYFEKEEEKQKENPQGRYFKNVCCDTNGKLTSFHTPKFEYKVGGVVNGGPSGIWVSNGADVLTSTYSNASSSYCGRPVIIELKGKESDFFDLRLIGDVEVLALYTKEEFKEKFNCGTSIPDHVREMLDAYECGEEEDEDF